MQKRNKLFKLILIIALFIIMQIPSAIFANAVTMTSILEGKVIQFYVGEDVNVFDALMAADSRLSHLKNGSCFTNMALSHDGNSSDYYSINGEVVHGIAQGNANIRITGTASCGAQDIYEEVNGVFAISVLRRPGVEVTGITGVTLHGTAGEDITLSGTVEPPNATEIDINWSIVSAGTTGATINNGVLSTTSSGTVVVRATITDGIEEGQDYIEEFTITIEEPFRGITGISGVPDEMTAGDKITLNGKTEPGNATYQSIKWSITDAGTTKATLNGKILSTPNPGKLILTATIESGNEDGSDFIQNFTIDVLAKDINIPHTGETSSSVFQWILFASGILFAITKTANRKKNKI